MGERNAKTSKCQNAKKSKGRCEERNGAAPAMGNRAAMGSRGRGVERPSGGMKSEGGMAGQHAPLGSWLIGTAIRLAFQFVDVKQYAKNIFEENAYALNLVAQFPGWDLWQSIGYSKGMFEDSEPRHRSA